MPYAEPPADASAEPRPLSTDGWGEITLAASGPRPGRVPAASRVWARVLPASLASLASGFGPGVVFRGRGFGPGVVSGVFFFASRARPASLARPGRVPGRLGRVPPRPGTRVSRVSAASPGPRVA